MAITITFDAEPHPLPLDAYRPVATESPLRRGAKGAIGDPERDAGIDAPEGAPLFSCGLDHGSSLLKTFAGRAVGLDNNGSPGLGALATAGPAVCADGLLPGLF